MVDFVGFNGREDGLIQAAYQNALNCLRAAHQSSGSGAYNIALEKYFGKSESYSKVTEVLAAMQASVDQPSFRFVRVASDKSFLSDDRGVFAAAEVFDYVSGLAPCDEEGGFKKYNRGILDKARSTGVLAIKILDEFFGLTERELDAESQVSTVLHELSHHAAHTVDCFVSVAAGHGLLGIKAANLFNKGQINAENYGFFVRSFGPF